MPAAVGGGQHPLPELQVVHDLGAACVGIAGEVAAAAVREAELVGDQVGFDPAEGGELVLEAGAVTVDPHLEEPGHGRVEGAEQGAQLPQEVLGEVARAADPGQVLGRALGLHDRAQRQHGLEQR